MLQVIVYVDLFKAIWVLWILLAIIILLRRNVPIFFCFCLIFISKNVNVFVEKRSFMWIIFGRYSCVIIFLVGYLIHILAQIGRDYWLINFHRIFIIFKNLILCLLVRVFHPNLIFLHLLLFCVNFDFLIIKYKFRILQFIQI